HTGGGGPTSAYSVYRLLRREAQFRPWAARLPEHRRLLARTLVPVDDRETSTRLQPLVHRACQPRPVRHAMEGVGHENKINRTPRQPHELIDVAGPVLAVGHTPLFQPDARYLQQRRVDIDRDDAACNLGNLQREPPVARADR